MKSACPDCECLCDWILFQTALSIITYIEFLEEYDYVNSFMRKYGGFVLALDLSCLSVTLKYRSHISQVILQDFKVA